MKEKTFLKELKKELLGEKMCLTEMDNMIHNVLKTNSVYERDYIVDAIEEKNYSYYINDDIDGIQVWLDVNFEIIEIDEDDNSNPVIKITSIDLI